MTGITTLATTTRCPSRTLPIRDDLLARGLGEDAPATAQGYSGL
jgi:hypothetical protein